MFDKTISISVFTNDEFMIQKKGTRNFLGKNRVEVEVAATSEKCLTSALLVIFFKIKKKLNY